MILVKDSKAKMGVRFYAFVRPRDLESEMWDGPRAGLEGAELHFGADKVGGMKLEEGK